MVHRQPWPCPNAPSAVVLTSAVVLMGRCGDGAPAAKAATSALSSVDLTGRGGGGCKTSEEEHDHCGGLQHPLPYRDAFLDL